MSDHIEVLRRLNDACLSRRLTSTECDELYAAISALAAQGGGEEMSPDFTDTARSALLWVLWHHQGASSPVGQPIRFALGMGSFDDLTDWHIRQAKRWEAISKPSPVPVERGEDALTWAEEIAKHDHEPQPAAHVADLYRDACDAIDAAHELSGTLAERITTLIKQRNDLTEGARVTDAARRLELVAQRLDPSNCKPAAENLRTFREITDEVRAIANALTPCAEDKCAHMRPMDKICDPCGRYPKRW